MYYLCKTFGTWKLYNATDNASKDLTPEQEGLLKVLFPVLMKEGVKAVEVIQINSLPPNKIMNLTLNAPPVAPQKGAVHQRAPDT